MTCRNGHGRLRRCRLSSSPQTGLVSTPVYLSTLRRLAEFLLTQRIFIDSTNGGSQNTDGGATTSGGSSSTGAIVGGVVGGIGAVLLGAGAWFFIRRRKNKKAAAAAEAGTAAAELPSSSQHPVSLPPFYDQHSPQSGMQELSHHHGQQIMNQDQVAKYYVPIPSHELPTAFLTSELPSQNEGTRWELDSTVVGPPGTRN